MADLEKWRAEGITQQLLYWLQLNTQTEIYGAGPAGGGSQPPMMLVFYRRHALLEPLWHVRALGSAVTGDSSLPDELLQQAKLLHWTGAIKPWMSVAAGNKFRKYFLPYEVPLVDGV